jgi:hypothetical protein
VFGGLARRCGYVVGVFVSVDKKQPNDGLDVRRIRASDNAREC